MKMRPVTVIALLLTMISYAIVDVRIIVPKQTGMYELQQSVLSGSEESPLQYSILAPSITFALQKLFGTIVMKNPEVRLLSFRIAAFSTFFILFFTLGLYLRTSLSGKQTILGLLIMQILLAFVLQNEWTLQAILNLIFFTMGMMLISLRREILLPLIILLGSLNQPQILALILYFIIYKFSEGELINLRTFAVTAVGTVTWVFSQSLLSSFYGLRSYVPDSSGFPETNVPALLIVAFVIFVLCVKGLRGAEKVQRMALMFIPLYIILALMLMPYGTLLDLAPVLLFAAPLAARSLPE